MRRIQNIRKETIFENPETQQSYRRVVGAMGWPWEPRPGFLVVLGEQYLVDQGLKGRPLEVLAEREVESIPALHQGCLELRKQWCCDIWLADLQQKEAVRLFRQINRGLNDRRNDIEPVQLHTAPYSHGAGQLQVLFQMLGMVQSPDHKLLSYGPDSKLPRYAQGLDSKDLKEKAGKFPALAALAYAVAEMILREPWSGKEPSQQVVTDWDCYA